MKKWTSGMLAGSLLIGLAAGPVYALDINAEGFGGYTTVSMAGMNTQLTNFAKLSGGSVTELGGGYYVGIDGNIGVGFPGLMVGPRLEYVSANPGTVVAPAGAYGPTAATFSLDSAAMLYEVGVNYTYALPGLPALSFRAGVWGGLGEEMASINASGGTTGTQDGSGSAFVGEFELQPRYRIVPNLNLGLDLGYRMADFATVDTTSSSGSFAGAANGKPLQNNSSTGAAVPFDMSGFKVGLNLNYSF